MRLATEEDEKKGGRCKKATNFVYFMIDQSTYMGNCHNGTSTNLQYTMGYLFGPTSYWYFNKGYVCSTCYAIHDTKKRAILNHTEDVYLYNL